MTALLAQTVDGIDVQAIKKRSADLQADAEAFVDQIKDRGDAFREEAVTVRDSGMENMRRVAAPENGRAACRARGCQYVEISGGAGALKKKHIKKQKRPQTAVRNKE